MGYIFDITAVLESLFHLMQAQGPGMDPKPVTIPLLELAARAYSNSPQRGRCHREIRTFVARTNIINRVDRDMVLQKVIDLIHDIHYVPDDAALEEARALVESTALVLRR